MGQGTEDLRWFALRVISQREQMVMKILRYDGLKAHVKLEQRLRRKTKKDPVRKPTPFCAAPSYVFIGLDFNRIDENGERPSPWKLVRRLHLIRSVVSLNGAPAELDPKALSEFLGFDDYNLPDHFKFFRTGQQEFKIGDTVRLAHPSFEGFELPVQDIQAGEAIFHLTLLGRIQELRLPVEQCYKAA